MYVYVSQPEGVVSLSIQIKHSYNKIHVYLLRQNKKQKHLIVIFVATVENGKFNTFLAQVTFDSSAVEDY